MSPAVGEDAPEAFHSAFPDYSPPQHFYSIIWRESKKMNCLRFVLFRFYFIIIIIIIIIIHLDHHNLLDWKLSHVVFRNVS